MYMLLNGKIPSSIWRRENCAQNGNKCLALIHWEANFFVSTSVLLRDNVCNEWVFFNSHAKSLFTQKGIKVIVEGCYQHLTWQGWGDPVWSQWVTSLNWPGPLVTRRGRRPWVFKSRTYAPWLVSEDCISVRQRLQFILAPARKTGKLLWLPITILWRNHDFHPNFY